MPIIIDPRTGLPFPVRTDRAPRDKRQGRVPEPGAIDQVNVQVLRDPGLHATPEDFGAGVGEAVADFSLAAAGVVKAFEDKRREAEDDTAGAAGLSDARVRFTTVARKMETQATTAEGFSANLDKALAEETDAILRDLSQVRGLRPSKGGEAAIRRRLGVLASRMVVRGARFENGVRLAQLGRAVDASVADAAMAVFNSPGDFPAIIAETEATLAKFKDKLPPDILVAKVAAARETIAHNTVAGLIELDPALALQGLKEGVFDDDLPAADRKRLRARAKAAVSDRRAQAERGQSRERAAAGGDGARRLVALEGAIARAEAGEQAIAEAADVLDEPTRARLREMLDARRAEDAARNRRIEKVSAVLTGRAPATGAGEGDGKPDGGGVKDENLRPGAPEWRQAVDDHYASLADALETMDPDTRARFEDDYAQATGVLPGAVLKRLRAGLLSADPAEQTAAATRLAGLEDIDPALVSVIPANERRRAQAIAGFAGLGLPPARAVELAEEKLADGNDQPAGGVGDDTLIGDVRGGSEDGGPLVGPGGVGQTDEKPGKPGPPAVRNAGPPTNKPVDVRDMYKKLGFDPNGRGQFEEFGRNSPAGLDAISLLGDADKKTAEQIRKGQFPKAGIAGGAADAFRHIYWSYRMTEKLGPDAAKKFGDGHEISVPTPDGDRLMDLFNNNLGRRLALDPANKGRPAEDVILEAIKKGHAQTQPFKTRSTKTRVTPPPGIPLRRKSPSGL